jgi:DNA-binding CsgD family transcriptional regulator
MGGEAGVAVGLLERAAELDVLSGLLDAAKRGEGRLVVVEGPAGIGKTGLLEACGEDAGKRGITALRVRADELVMGSSFAAVRELLWPQVRTRPDMFDGPARLARSLFEPGADGRVDHDRAAAVLHGLYWLVAGLADPGPLLLVVDDAHWLDAASARFLVYLARRVDSLPVLLAVGVRRGERGGRTQLVAGLSEVAAHVLTPAPLSEDAAGVLVRRTLGVRADEELCRSCHAATGGNPFYLRELANALQRADRRPTMAVAKSVRSLGVGAVARSVLFRLARLGPDCERLAQALAVLTPGSPLRHAATLAGLGRPRAEAAADALRAADLLAPGQALSYAHPIVREAVAAEMTSSRRAALHSAAARLLAEDGALADRVAAHLLSAEPYGEAWVVEALRLAAGQALVQGAPEAAVAFLRRAVSEPPAPETRLDVLLELGRAEALQPVEHDFAGLREALELAVDRHQRAEIVLELAWGLTGVTRNAETAILLERLLVDGEHLDSALVERIEALLIGGGAVDLRATRAALARAERHFERAKRGEIRDSVMLAALAMTGAIAGRPAADSAALATRALRDESLLERHGPAYGGATAGLYFAEHFDDAARAQDAGITWAQRRGSAPTFMQMSSWRGVTALRVGELDVAEDHLRRAWGIGRELGARLYAVMFLIGVLLERGSVEEAFELVESSGLGVPHLALWQGVLVLAQRGRVNVSRGELEAGVADLLDADRRMVAAGLQLSVLVDWAATAALALAQLGRHDEATRLAAAELAHAIAFGAPRRHGMALSTCGALKPGAQGLAWLREACEILERSPARLEHARALVNLGAGLRPRGQLEPAREALSRALDIAYRLGAVALADRARAELVASGARPRRDALRGPGALTPAELRTAGMAAGGLTNREIAQALFVSAKTVEAQLSHAYAKLAIDGRSQLGAALRNASSQ